MLRDHEKQAVMSILVRVIESQDEREMLEKQLAVVNARLQDARALRTNAMSALRVFGFDIGSDNLWDTVRDEIGREAYSRAFTLARPVIRGASAAGSESSDRQEDVTTEAKDTKSSDSTTSDVKTGSAPNIRELILQRLNELGESGAKALEIRSYVQSFGFNMHEKTVGMTLYRLSKDGLVARDGRRWFRVEPRGENKEAEDGDKEQSSATIFD